jgi:diguanylate cyclase (GGDEF)-like protein
MLRAERSGGAVGLMFLDLDGFKQVNDTLGHQAGDELLIQFSRRLASIVRKSDTVARLAGDEFTVLLEGLVSPAEDGKAIADKIIASMQQPFIVCGREASVTVSIGLAIHDANTRGIDVAELLRRADKQMYAAKHAGKNAYSMA